MSMRLRQPCVDWRWLRHPAHAEWYDYRRS